MQNKRHIRIGKVTIKEGYEEPRSLRGARMLVWEDGQVEAYFVEAAPGVWERSTFLRYVRSIR